MKKIALLLLFSFSSLCFAEEAKYILIRPFKGQEKLNSSLHSAVKRTILKKITEMPGYNLVLSAEAPPSGSVLQTFALEGVIIEEKEFYRVELLLLDLKKQTLINAVKKSGIREEDLVRIIQGAIEALFLPIEKKSSVIEKNRVRSNAAPEDFNSLVNVANEDALNFKERIQGLMSDTDKAIINKTNANANNSDSPVDKEASENQSLKTAKILTTQEKENFFNKESMLKILKHHAVSALFEKKSIETKSFIDTSSEASYFRLMARGHIWRNSNYKHSVNYSFDYSKALDVKVTSPNLISYGLMWRTELENLSLGAGPSKESELFYNIQSPGSGLEAGTTSITWLNLMIQKKIGREAIPWLFLMQYKHALSSQSQWKTISSSQSVQGQAFQVEISPPIVVKGINFRIMYQRTNLKLPGELPFTLSENRFMTGAHYQF